MPLPSSPPPLGGPTARPQRPVEAGLGDGVVVIRRGGDPTGPTASGLNAGASLTGTIVVLEGVWWVLVEVMVRALPMGQNTPTG